MSARRATPLLGAATLLLSAACGGGGSSQGAAFANDWQNDDGASVRPLVQRLSGAKLPEGPGLAVGVTKTGIVGVHLDGTHRFKVAAAPDARPAIAGELVLYTERGQLVALDASNGAVAWRISVGEKHLRGAGSDGETTVASLGGDAGGGTLLVAVGRGGSVLQRWTPQHDLGIPAVAGGVVFAPWGNQYVSALDVSNGSELGRILARTVMSRAMSVGGSLYFGGEQGFVRFDEAITRAARNEAHLVRLPRRELPGTPLWYPDGALVLPPTAGAPDSIRYYARPKPNGAQLGIEGDRLAATYFRIVLGMNANDGVIRWVRTFPAEILGGDAAVGGFALCDEKGDVWLTNGRAGGDAGKASLGEPVMSCVVNAGSIHVAAGKDTSSLAEQITEAVSLREAQMVTIQRFLLRELARDEDPAVTRKLLDLASDARTSPDLLEESRALLAARRSGADLMMEALGRHYDYLSDVLRPPPVGPLADALGALGEKRAAPLLASHLNDPSDSPDDVKRAARALVTLATPAEREAVQTFFVLYRATADEEALVAAVVDAARILMRLGGPDGADLVKNAAADPLTNPLVRAGLAQVTTDGSKG